MLICKAGVGVCFFIPFVAPFITHVVVAFLAYPYMAVCGAMVCVIMCLFLGVCCIHPCTLFFCGEDFTNGHAGCMPGDNAGVVLVPVAFFIAFTFMTQTWLTYAAFLYGRGGGTGEYYVQNIADEYYARNTRHYWNCVAKGARETIFDLIRAYL